MIDSEIFKLFSFKKTAVTEAIDNKRREKGETPFLKSTFSDPHIQKIINYLVGYYNTHPNAEMPEDALTKLLQKSSKTGYVSEVHAKHAAGQQITAQDFKKDIEAELALIADRQKISPAMYDIAVQNLPEMTLYGFLQGVAEHNSIPNAEQFKYSTFKKLWDRIVVEHKSLFPLKNLGDTKSIRPDKIRLVIVPTEIKEYKQFNSVHTAAATPDGVFIFNAKCCQELLNWGAIKQNTPKGMKYANNGGPFNPAWAYVEFLILHELYHFSYGDFYYTDKHKLNRNTVNYTGDYRSNYDLVKAGYEQVPWMIYSDDLNLDRFKNYSELYKAVQAELDKFKKNDKDKDKKKQDDENQRKDKNPAQNDGDDQEWDEDPLGPRDHDHEEPAEPSEDGEPGDLSDVDEHIGKTREKTNGDPNPNDPGEHSDEGSGEAKERPKLKTKGGRSSSTTDSSTGFDWKKQRPRFSWKQIIDKCAKAEVETEDTYFKPSASIASRMEIARQIGSSAVKPGEMEDPQFVKLAFIIDRSGSMSHVIEKITAEIYQVMKTHGANEMYFIPFSNSHKVYLVNFSKKSARQVDAKTLVPRGESTTLDHLLSNGEFGGTNFTSDMVDLAKKLTSQGWNVIMASDNDVLWGENINEFAKYAHIQHAYTIFDSRDTWVQALSTLNLKPDSVSYFE